MNRTQQFLIALLIVQSILAAVMFWPEPQPVVDGGPLLTNWDAAGVTALKIEDDSGNRIEVTRAGDEWVVANAGDFPVTSGTAESLLGKFGAMNTDRLVTRTAGSHDRLQVAADAFLRRITITREDGGTQTFFLGSSQTALVVHVRLENEDTVYLTSAVNIWEAAATIGSWVDTRYVQLEQGSLTGVTLQNESGRYSFSPIAGGGWRLEDLAEGETPNAQTINNLIFRLPGLRFTRPVGTTADPAYGLDAPAATMTMSTTAGTEELRIGAQAGNGDYYAAYTGSDYIVLLAESSAADFVNGVRDDFLGGADVEE